ncbi:MAG: dihydrofolate reductase [Thiomonas sp.]
MPIPQHQNTGPRVAIIAAVAHNQVIGRGHALIWHLPADLAHFKRVTLGHPILMGRKTWESIGRPLPGRRNVVISRDADFIAPGAETSTSLSDAMSICAEAPEVFIVGGAKIYAQAIPLAQQLWLTEIHAEPQGDVYFPAWNRDAFVEVSRDPHPAQGNLPAFDFVLYERKA